MQMLGSFAEFERSMVANGPALAWRPLAIAELGLAGPPN
jgi:hypothetical protein